MAVLTAGLRNLQDQLDAAFPGREKPDGWLGDAAHRTRTSSHNPDDTAGSKPAWDGDGDKLREVRALDISAHLGEGVDSLDVVRHLCRLPKLAEVIRYLIHRGHIYHARNSFEPEDYDGANRHDGHIHAEGAWTQAADNNTSFDFRLQEVPVALTNADKEWLKETVEAAVDRRVGDVVPRLGPDGKPLPLSADNPTMTVNSALFYVARDLDAIKKAFVPPA